MRRRVHSTTGGRWRCTTLLFHSLREDLILPPLSSGTTLLFRPRASVPQSTPKREKVKRVLTVFPSALTRCTDLFSRLVPSSTRDFESLCSSSTSGYRQAVFRYSFHRFRIGPSQNLVVGPTSEGVRHLPNHRHFHVLPHLLGSSYYTTRLIVDDPGGKDQGCMMAAGKTTCEGFDDRRGTSLSEHCLSMGRRRERAIRFRTVHSRLRAIAGWGGMRRRDGAQNPLGRNCTADRQTSEASRNDCLGHRSAANGADSATRSQRGCRWLADRGGMNRLCGKRR